MGRTRVSFLPASERPPKSPLPHEIYWYHAPYRDRNRAQRFPERFFSLSPGTLLAPPLACGFFAPRVRHDGALPPLRVIKCSRGGVRLCPAARSSFNDEAALLTRSSPTP